MPQGAVNAGIPGNGMRMPALSRRALEGLAFALACAATVWSAATVKQAARVPSLMAVHGASNSAPAPSLAPATPPTERFSAQPGPLTSTDGSFSQPHHANGPTDPSAPASLPPVSTANESPPEPGTRWFNGRPIRPAHVMWMTVTAYTPGPESCWPSDDGITATLHCVTTNAGALVAADTDVLPFGSLVSIEGYDASSVVPVLDRGGKIRGRRLDVLMPTVEDARSWGVRRVPVVVWEYADGQTLTDPRRVR